MAWADGEDVINRVEELMKALWLEFSDQTPAPAFDRMRYHDAMTKYGSDKPDLRIPGLVGLTYSSLKLTLTRSDPSDRSYCSQPPTQHAHCFERSCI
jgi:aspartyl-tRNA synthetase